MQLAVAGALELRRLRERTQSRLDLWPCCPIHRALDLDHDPFASAVILSQDEQVGALVADTERSARIAGNGKPETSNAEATTLVADWARSAVCRIQTILDEALTVAMLLANPLSVDHARLSIRRDVSSDCSVATSTYSSSGMPQSGSMSTRATSTAPPGSVRWNRCTAMSPKPRPSMGS